jgi:transposase
MATGIFRKNFPQVDKLQKKVDEADYIIGLDLHKKTTAITVVDVSQPEQPVFRRKRLKNNELIEVLRRFPGNKMVIAEAAYGWFSLRRALEGMKDITFVLFDTRKTSAWIKTSGIKNDRIDSEVLAYACLKGGLPALAVYLPDEIYRSRFRLVTFRDHLVSQRTRVKNQMKAIERDYSLNTYTGEVADLHYTPGSNAALTV